MKKRGRPVGSGQVSVVGNTNTGKLLRSARKAAGLGLADVARSAGISFQFISNIEHARAPLPLQYVRSVAKVLKVEASKLFVAIVADRVAKTEAQYKEVA